MDRKEFDKILEDLWVIGMIDSEGESPEEIATSEDITKLVRAVEKVIPDTSTDQTVACAARDYILVCSAFLISTIKDLSECNIDYIIKLLDLEEIYEDDPTCNSPFKVLMNDLNECLDDNKKMDELSKKLNNSKKLDKIVRDGYVLKNKEVFAELSLSAYKNLHLLPFHERKCALYMACHSLMRLIYA